MGLTNVIKCAVPAVIWILYFGCPVYSRILDLSFRGLKKEDFFIELQSKINIHEVTILKLAGNQFDSFLDCSTDLQSLEVLDLSQNHLKKFFFLCKSEYNLQSLNISNNRLEYIDDNAINSRVSKLKILDLSNNMMTGINDTMLEHMRQLTFLSLTNNPIGDDLDEYSFWNLSELRVLHLKNISATYFSPVLFQTLQNLTELDISMNPIEVVPPLPPLIEILDLSETNLLYLGNLMLPNLRNLQMNNMPNLTTALLNYFENLTSLENLSMAGCGKLLQLKVWPPHPRLLPQLQHLSVRNCAIESLSVELRPILQRTPILDLQNNPWTCDCRLKWVHAMNLTTDPSHKIKCLYPSQHRNKYLMQIPEEELQCEEPSNVTGAVLWSCFSIFMISCAIAGFVFFYKRRFTCLSSMGKWTMIRKGQSRETISYANVVESSNDLVRILSDGDAVLRNED